MGILDDAIREHLELKRRRGADPGTVAKLEHEAFGPIERDEALDVPSPFAGEADEVAAEEERDYAESELEAEEQWQAAHPAPVLADQAPYSPPVPPEPEPEPEPVAEAEVLPPEIRRLEVPEDRAPEVVEDLGERTAEFTAVDVEPDPQPDAEPEAEPGEHDELEETPEFLQETPEHDRLWFEQKPPRDFDF